MDPMVAIDIGRQAIMITLIISGPLLAAGLAVGLLIGIFQAVTQIHEMTLTFIPKIIAMVGLLVFMLPWMLIKVVDYTVNLIESHSNGRAVESGCMTFAGIAVDRIEIFLLVFVRIVSMIALLPFFGSGNVPVVLKAGLSFALAIVLFPSVLALGKIPEPAASLGAFFVLVIREIFAGILVGFVASFLFTATQFAGRLIDTEMGFALVELVDPFTEETVTTMGQLSVLIFTILFLLLNGHYFLILAIQKSFIALPLTGVHMPDGPLVSFLITLTANVFDAALRLSAPVFVTLFLTSVSMGIIARTVPQINVFFVGVPLTIILGLSTTIIALPFMASVFRKLADGLMQDIWRLLYLMA